MTDLTDSKHGVFEALNLIGGALLPARGGLWLEAKSPFTGAVVGRLPNSDLMDVVAAVQAANKALPEWQKLDDSSRARRLHEVATLLRENAAELTQLQSLETGLSLHASAGGVAQAADAFDSFSQQWLARTEDSVSSEKGWFRTRRSAVGLVAVITPWVQPIATLASRVAPALVCGNAVVAKPSSLVPRSAQRFAELLQSRLPAGVFNLVQGRGGEAGQALVSHPAITALTFCGRTSTGAAIQVQAGEFSKRLQMSLSASCAALVFSDVDLATVAPLLAKMCLGGWLSPELRPARLFVQDAIYEPFREAFAEAALALKLGAPEEAEVGPMVSEAAQTAFLSAVALASKENGRLLFGSGEKLARAGYFVEPTAFFDLTLCSTLQQDEILGPFALISSFKYQHDAIKRANQSPYGQVALVFQKDGSKALKVAEKLEVGRVLVNANDDLRDSRLIYDGFKLSGLGAESGQAWLDFFSRRSIIAGTW